MLNNFNHFVQIKPLNLAPTLAPKLQRPLRITSTPFRYIVSMRLTTVVAGNDHTISDRQ